MRKDNPLFKDGEHLKLWEAINSQKIEIVKMQKDIEWMKKTQDEIKETFGQAYGKISHRMWWVLGSVVALGLISIFAAVVS